MVIQSINGLYMHSAWATSAQGADFSLTEFGDATYRGFYYDHSPAESTEPIAYKWMLIDTIDGEGAQDDALDAENAAAIANAQAEQANSQAIVNNSNLQATQYSTDDKTGNANELIGTNQGTNGWTASAGLTLSAVTDTIYNDTDTPVNYLHIVCNAAGANYAYFDAAALRDKLAELTEDNAFTFSADIRQSIVFAVDVAIQNTNGSGTQLDLGTIDNSLIPVPEESADDLWTFNKLTAEVIGGVAATNQVLYFDLSTMGAGDTMDIANLKIEGGAIATPWRASLDEVAQIANQAYQVAGNTQQHFWFTSVGADTGAHITEVTGEEFTDPLSPYYHTGGNLLARSNGIAIRDGLDELVTIDATAIDIGDKSQQFARITPLGGLNLCKNSMVVGELSVDEITNTVTLKETTTNQVFEIGAIGCFMGSDNGVDGLRANGGNIYINGVQLIDYVIQRGTSGNWHYIKWASGRVELEGYYTFASLSFSASGNMYRSISNTFTIPSGIFTSAPTEGQAWIQGSNTVYPSVSIGGLTTTGGNCQIWKSTSGNATNVSVHMRIVYR